MENDIEIITAWERFAKKLELAKWAFSPFLWLDWLCRSLMVAGLIAIVFEVRGLALIERVDPIPIDDVSTTLPSKTRKS